MKKTMKKVIALMLSVLFVASCFAGCSANSTKNSDAKTYTVGICQLVQHDALDAATKGFKAALTERLGDKVKFEEKNAQGDSPTAATICNGFVSSGVDLIMANATPALQAAAAATSTIPIVGTSVSNFGIALDIKYYKGATGKNITGTSDLAPLDKQAEMIKELAPKAKTVGILYCSAEANSKYQATEIEKTLKTLGLAYKEYTFADSNDLSSVATTAVGECDAIYVPTDNTVASNTGILNNIAEPAKIPVIAGEEGICKGCGIATLSISYYDIGYKAGEMAYDILVNGKDPSTMEVASPEALTKKYMKDRASKIGVTIPSDYKEIDTSAK